MKEGRLYFINTPDPNRPVELKYLAEFDDTQKWFEKQEDAQIFLFDNGVTKYKFLTKRLSEYISLKNLQTFELWQLENRVGYVTDGYDRYYDENDKLQQKKAYVWRFIGYGRSCFAGTQEELKDKVLSLIHCYKEDPEECGHNSYPYYTRYYRKGGRQMKNFIAFDFETANRNRHSICAVGMVFVNDGKIVDTIYQLINPEENFEGINVAIHNITAKDVKDAPTFDVFYQSIKDKIHNQIMVAHNLGFDGYALRDNIQRYQVKPANNHLLCTYQLSKRLVLGKTSYSLNTLCQYYGINIINHHNALDDATACAELMLKLIEEYELEDFETIFNKTHIRPGIISPEHFRSSLISSKNKSKLDLSEIKVSEDAENAHPFYGKNIVFTGKLNLFSRREAAQLVADKGGTPQNGINKETDYIIIGNFEDLMIKGNKSSKLEKAEKMISEGKQLEIVSEEDFMKML